MRIGLQWTPEAVPLPSVKRLVSVIHAELHQEFEVESLPPYFPLLRPEAQRREWERLFNSVDVVLGSWEALGARALLKSKLPILYFALGDMPRGANGLRMYFETLSKRDTVVFSSTADRAIFEQLWRECRARTALLPFFVDPQFSRFTEERRSRLRQAFALSEDDVLFVYAGRLSAEKNFHSVVRVFAALTSRRPNTYLAAVGPLENDVFFDFRSGPVDMAALYMDLALRHPVALERGRLNPTSVATTALATVLNTADVFMNLTLHHDENFGFTQAEAMACGLPVIGTDWGGLKDTIQQGETGFRVDARLTRWGVRADLRQALEYAEELAASRELRRRMGTAAMVAAQKLYSRERFAESLRRLVVDACSPRSGGAARNRLSPFGERFQREFQGTRPHYVRANYDLYAQLIGPYASTVPESVPSENDWIFLSFPLLRVEGPKVTTRDPMWPIMEDVGHAAGALISWLEREDAEGRTFTPAGRVHAWLRETFPNEAAEFLLDRLVQEGILSRSASGARPHDGAP